MNDQDKIDISGKVSPTNSQICTFTVTQPLYPEKSFNCSTKKLAKGSPLLEGLFDMTGVVQVLVAENRLTVQKDSDESWPELGKKIGQFIRTALRSGKVLINPDAFKPGLEEHIRRRVHQILESEINPGLASHGGQADLVDVKGTSVYVRFVGGCQGCSSSQVTLKQGIEKSVFSQVPEVTEVIDVTNHSDGKNPYFSSQGNSPFQG